MAVLTKGPWKSFLITEGSPLRLVAFLLAPFLWWAAFSAELASQPPEPQPEHKVKAAYVYHSGFFIRWPNLESIATFRIGVVGENPFGGILVNLAKGQTLRGKPIDVRQFRAADSINAQVVYISSSEANRMQSLLESLAGRSVLTVSDIPGFAKAGGCIELVTIGNNIRLTANLDAIRANGLRASSELLAAAVEVIEKETSP